MRDLERENNFLSKKKNDGVNIYVSYVRCVCLGFLSVATYQSVYIAAPFNLMDEAV